MSEHRVALDAQLGGDRGNVPCHLVQSPAVCVAVAMGTALRPLVDEDQPVPLAERIQVVAELVMVQPGPAMQDQQWRSGQVTALLDPQLGVADVQELSRYPS